MPPSPDISEIAESLLSVMRLLRKRVDAAMAKQGLSLARGALLCAVQQGGQCRPGELAVQLGLSPRSITDALDAMEQDGLVTRQRHPTDRRAQLVSLTAKGEAALHQAEVPRLLAIEQLLSGLDDNQRGQLLAALRVINRQG
ncbi:MarR family transcriptional regulator [Chimaeribacter californicus]|uniref:MarR family transcriptional regulator n=1 Tax=Chimaeribacter californicus TaxID=2060067 RepID=A0A2N5DVY8_9GAMM|nr:MarR family transcriptional regulator [Chimaeribacter californicus]PLR31297.1 MarR family transcriptional regulator [Chimaeribacter californicus]